ncbi:hypothetical protein CHUAL_012784 [Chamberlinius hualienensis]
MRSNVYVSIAILAVLLYSWRVGENLRDKSLAEVYYGVQIALLAIISMQFGLMALTVLLLIGINQERGNLIVPWIIGFITFISLEAVCIVYSNILREHVNKRFDAICKAEVAFFLARLILNALSIVGVVKFYQDVRTGISWKEPEAIEV